MGKNKKHLVINGLKYMMAAAAGIYIISVFTFLKELRYSSLAWLIFAIYLIVVVFVWKLSGKRRTESKTDSDKEAEISKEIFRERNKWFML